MNKLCIGIKCYKVPDFSNATQMKMSRVADITNMIMKSEILVKNPPRSLTLEDGNTCESPTLIDKLLKFCFKSGDRKINKTMLYFTNPLNGRMPVVQYTLCYLKYISNRF